MALIFQGSFQCILCLSYLCIKVRQKFEVYDQSGGMFDWMNKGNVPVQDIDESVQFIILIGLLLVIINAFTNLFLYLKNKEESKNDSVARTIYQSQLVILLFMVTTLLFLMITNINTGFFPGDDGTALPGILWLSTRTGEKVKWSLILIFMGIGSFLINRHADSGFFGL